MAFTDRGEIDSGGKHFQAGWAKDARENRFKRSLLSNYRNAVYAELAELERLLSVANSAEQLGGRTAVASWSSVSSPGFCGEAALPACRSGPVGTEGGFLFFF